MLALKASVAVLQQLREDPQYTLPLMQGEEMISRQQNIYPRAGQSTVKRGRADDENVAGCE